jgi:hypothetical protein
MYSNISNNKVNYGEGYRNKISVDNIVFDEKNSQIILKNLKIDLNVSHRDYANSYAVAMIRIEGINENEKEEPVKTYWSTKAFVYNGQLILEGDLDKASLKASRSGFKINRAELGSYNLSDDNYEIDVASIINTKSGITMDDIQVTCYVDYGNLGIGIPDKYAIDFKNNTTVASINESLLQNSNFTFNFYPNPANNVLNIDIINKMESTYSIQIIDLQGKFIKNIETLNLQQNENKNLIIDLSDISHGVYLLEFTNKNEKYSRKFIKE